MILANGCRELGLFFGDKREIKSKQIQSKMSVIQSTYNSTQPPTKTGLAPSAECPGWPSLKRPSGSRPGGLAPW